MFVPLWVPGVLLMILAIWTLVKAMRSDQDFVNRKHAEDSTLVFTHTSKTRAALHASVFYFIASPFVLLLAVACFMAAVANP